VKRPQLQGHVVCKFYPPGTVLWIKDGKVVTARYPKPKK
jgi:hypothetical protein